MPTQKPASHTYIQLPSLHQCIYSIQLSTPHCYVSTSGCSFPTSPHIWSKFKLGNKVCSQKWVVCAKESWGNIWGVRCKGCSGEYADDYEIVVIRVVSLLWYFARWSHGQISCDTYVDGDIMLWYEMNAGFTATSSKKKKKKKRVRGMKTEMNTSIHKPSSNMTIAFGYIYSSPSAFACFHVQLSMRATYSISPVQPKSDQISGAVHPDQPSLHIPSHKPRRLHLWTIPLQTPLIHIHQLTCTPASFSIEKD